MFDLDTKQRSTALISIIWIFHYPDWGQSQQIQITDFLQYSSKFILEHCGGEPEQAANMHMNRLSFTLK